MHNVGLFVQKLLKGRAVEMFSLNVGAFVRLSFHGLVWQAVNALNGILSFEQAADDGVA